MELFTLVVEAKIVDYMSGLGDRVAKLIKSSPLSQV
jgi:hypothetical protein